MVPKFEWRYREYMPNIKSAKKRVKVTETKTLQNKMFKSAMKTSIKKYKAAVAEGNKELAEKTYLEAVGMVDRAVSKGIIHKNNAARKKSQYTKLLNGIA
jgi:small subunit ribosomal protein S20